MIISFLSSLAFWDAALIVVVVLSTIAAFIYVGHCYWMATGSSRRQRLVRATSRFCDKLDKFNEFFSDDEPYDPEWMDYEKWKETRIEG